MGGEAGLVGYDGRWSIAALAGVARRLQGPYAPAVPPEDLARVELQIERLRDLLFEIVFLEGSTESSGAAMQGAGKASWLGRLFGSGPAKATAQVREDLESKLDFSGGVAVAVSSCELVLKAAQRPRQTD